MSKRPPDDVPPPVEAPPTTEPLVGEEGAARLLFTTPSHIEKLRLKRGLPFIDLSIGVPGKRKKGLYRYCPADLIAWARSRNGGG